jgi:hypothetical protein
MSELPEDSLQTAKALILFRENGLPGNAAVQSPLVVVERERQ